MGHLLCEPDEWMSPRIRPDTWGKRRRLPDASGIGSNAERE